MLERWISIDPGGATGWSVWAIDQFDEDMPITREAFGVVSGGLHGLRERLDMLMVGIDLVICESFELDATAAPDLTPKLIEGALMLETWRRGLELVFSHRSQKARVKDEALKRVDLWITGKPVGWEDGRDVNDSSKHALAHALDLEADARAQPTTRWLYPPR